MKVKRNSEKIAKIKPNSQEFEQLKFILSNKDKIIGNMRLINLLG